MVPETSIMIEHLDLHHPGETSLLPGDRAAQLEVRLWDRIFDNYVMGPVQRFVAQHLRPEAERDTPTLAASVAELATAYGLLDERLRGRTWAAGESFSMADCAAAPALFYAATVLPFPAGHAALAGYFERLMQRPSVARAIAEARPWFQYFPLRHALPARFLSEGADAT